MSYFNIYDSSYPVVFAVLHVLWFSLLSLGHMSRCNTLSEQSDKYTNSVLQLIVDIVQTYIALFVIGNHPCKLAPCKNGGVCKAKEYNEKEYVCMCKGGYTGIHCTGGCM